MSKFDKGVSYYTTAKLSIEVHFPEDEVKCKWCPFLKHYDSIDRDKCGITQEILYSREITGQRCPLGFKAEEESEVFEL